MVAASARLPLLLAVFATAWMLLQGIAGVGDGLAMLAPALLLVVPLLAGRYPGEEALERVRLARLAPPRSRRRALRTGGPRRSRACVPRGGMLLAARLAKRPPPAAVALQPA